jgi:D-aminopeptidase
MMLDPIRKAVLPRFHHPCIGETNDGFLNGRDGGHVTEAHVDDVLRGLRSGAVEEGCVGGGTGMMAYGFKAGIGTASRIAQTEVGAFTVGVLVQSNHGRRKDLRFEGISVGKLIGASRIPEPVRPEDGSIVMVVATDAPLIPTQCDRLAQRAVSGVGRVGSLGQNTSGEFAIAFSTANCLPALGGSVVDGLRMFPNDKISPLFEATIEATEAAVINSLLAAKTTEGANGAKAWALERSVLEKALADARGSPPETSSPSSKTRQ